MADIKSFYYSIYTGAASATQRATLARFCQITALALTLTANSGFAIAADLESGTTPESAEELFLSPDHGDRSILMHSVEAGRQAVQFNRALARLPLQSAARFSLPRGVSYELTFDNRLDHPSGNVTWIGALKGYGDDYRAVITFGDGGVSGRIMTPDGEFLVETDAHGEWLVDVQAAGLTPEGPGEDDALIPVLEETHKRLPKNGPGASDLPEDDSFSDKPVAKKDSLAQFLYSEEGDQQITAADSTPTTIDVMILYTPGLASRLGSGLSARLDQLVALSNQAYRDSGIYIDLRLVHTQQVNYSDTTTNDTALNALTQGSDPALTDVVSLRNTYGADLVSLIRPFNINASGGSCGVAWVNGYNGQSISLFANYGYSVISDGRDVNGSNYYCLDLTFAHELGHNMGSVHDRANSSFQGAYPYSYGYGVSGTFGTVMSYINPRIAKFSNPGITCAGGIACGISETTANSANNALSLNNTRQAIANFRAQQVPPSLPPPPPPPTFHTLSVIKSGSGTVTSNPAGIDCGGDCSESYVSGTSVTLNATPDSGQMFSGWSGACAGTGTCTVTMTAARSVTATFKAIPKYTLTVRRSGSGTVTGPGINCGGDCSEPYLSGTVVTLTATPASGYYFSGWSGACTGTEGCAVTMTAAKSVTATFKR